ncbi:MAG: hypothetical protein K8S18_08055 [Desulfobacula sp.]|nr:hypothetical protein [Desulfobacula sp.]
MIALTNLSQKLNQNEKKIFLIGMALFLFCAINYDVGAFGLDSSVSINSMLTENTNEQTLFIGPPSNLRVIDISKKDSKIKVEENSNKIILPIREHGTYSDQYIGNWETLPTGKDYKRRSEIDFTFKVVSGNKAKEKYFDKSEVILKNKAYKVYWKNEYDKYGNTLFSIRGAENVIVENIAVIQMDPNYKASHSLLIEDCQNVIIRDSLFAGSSNKFHIRVEGCTNVLIDNIEIAGYDYGSKIGVRCGGGIWVNNGDQKAGGNLGRFSPKPFDMKSSVIQNSYFHDNLTEAKNKWRNQDAVCIGSAGNGVIFNCYFENWLKGDAALDISHSRSDKSYKKQSFRAERNIFKNCRLTKINGLSDSSNNVLFINNLYINTFHADYHKGWDSYHINETFILKDARKSGFQDVFFKIWGIDNGNTYFRNCLFYVFDKRINKFIYMSANYDPDDYRFVNFDNCVYLMPQPDYWLRGKNGEQFKTWKEWKKISGNDANSTFSNVKEQSCFHNSEQDDYRLSKDTFLAKDKYSNFVNIKNNTFIIDKDFFGKKREKATAAGAFEFY